MWPNWSTILSLRIINRAAAGRKAERAVRAEAERLARLGRTRLKASVPVRTGKMKAQVKIIQRLGALRLLSTVEYAKYVVRYVRAVARTRRFLRSKFRKISIEVEVIDRHGAKGRRQIKLAPSRVFRLGGGQTEATLRAAKTVRFPARGLSYEVAFST